MVGAPGCTPMLVVGDLVPVFQFLSRSVYTTQNGRALEHLDVRTVGRTRPQLLAPGLLKRGF